MLSWVHRGYEKLLWPRGMSELSLVADDLVGAFYIELIALGLYIASGNKPTICIKWLSMSCFTEKKVYWNVTGWLIKQECLKMLIFSIETKLRFLKQILTLNLQLTLLQMHMF